MSMKPFKHSVHSYRSALTADYMQRFGFVNSEQQAQIKRMVHEYAIARNAWKIAERNRLSGDYFNPFTNDPNCKSCGKKKRNFNDLIDIHSGQTCYIVGKGPSVDKWIEAGKPVEPGSITMGINSIADYIKFDYAVFERPDVMNPLPGQKIFFTTKQGIEKTYEEKGWRYFPHQDDPNRTRIRLRWTKEQLANSGRFYSASSTVQHAIHIAWLMGCSDIVLVGIDGGSGYSNLITDQKPDTASKYNLMRFDTEAELEILFNGNWKDFFHPTRGNSKQKKKRQ